MLNNLNISSDDKLNIYKYITEVKKLSMLILKAWFYMNFMS